MTLTLSEYITIAEKLISSSGCRWMLQDEYIGIVVNGLIDSDNKYIKGAGSSIESYRYGGWLNTKKRIFFLNKARFKNQSIETLTNQLSVSVPPCDELIQREDAGFLSSTINDIVNNEHLTETEREYLRLIYVDGKKRIEVANLFNITRQAVSFVERNAIKKLRGLYV